MAGFEARAAHALSHLPGAACSHAAPTFIRIVRRRIDAYNPASRKQPQQTWTSRQIRLLWEDWQALWSMGQELARWRGDPDLGSRGRSSSTDSLRPTHESQHFKFP